MSGNRIQRNQPWGSTPLPTSIRLVSHSCEWIKLTGGRTESCGAQAVKASPSSALSTGAAPYPLTGKILSLSTVTHLAAACMFVIKDYKMKTNTPTQAQPDQTLVVMVTEFCHGSLVDWGSRKKSSLFILIGAWTIC